MKSTILIITTLLFGAVLVFSSDNASVLSPEQAAGYRAGQVPIPSDETDPTKLTDECVANVHNCNTCVGVVKCDRDRKLPACKKTKKETECLPAVVNCGAGKVYRFVPCVTLLGAGINCKANACF